MAFLDVRTGDRARLRAVIVFASDTGLRQTELLTLSWRARDIDFENRLIKLRAINAKSNKPRAILMTRRVYEEPLKLKEQNGCHPSGLIFGGLKGVKRHEGIHRECSSRRKSTTLSTCLREQPMHIHPRIGFRVARERGRNDKCFMVVFEPDQE